MFFLFFFNDPNYILIQMFFFYAFSCREHSRRLSSETLAFYYWTENDRFHEGSLDSFDVIPGQHNSDSEGDDDSNDDQAIRHH